MEIHQLHCFIELSKFQNMSMAAESLGVTQPALSKTIALLEADLGVKLFDRVGRRIVLNENGKQFVSYAQKSMELLEQGRTVIREQDHQPVGIVTIALFSYTDLIDDCLTEYMKRYPKVNFRMFSSKSQFTIENFDSVDLMLSSSLSDTPFRRKDFMDSIKVMEEDYVLVAAPELLAAYGVPTNEKQELKAFRELPFIAMADNLMFNDITFRFCQEVDFLPRVTVQTNDFATKVHLVERGAVISFIPEACIPIFKGIREDLCIIYPQDIERKRSIWLSCRNHVEVSPAVESFWKFAKTYYQ